MRYIDADKFIAELEQEKAEALEFEDGVAAYEIEHTMNLISMQPTADVVPKSEVEKIFAEIEKIRLKEIHKCETLREQENEVSQRKYWEGGYNSLRQLSYWIAELKKKYTENKE